MRGRQRSNVQTSRVWYAYQDYSPGCIQGCKQGYRYCVVNDSCRWAVPVSCGCLQGSHQWADPSESFVALQKWVVVEGQGSQLRLEKISPAS
jgi:hypothetical protein